MSDEPTTEVRRGKKLPWRQDPEILARLPEVERRYLRGMFNTKIAEELGVSERTVREDINRLNQLWQERAGDQVDAMRAARFRELEAVKRLALESFDFDMEALRAVLYGEQHVVRDDDGRAQYKADKVAALAQYRQAVMDQAKLYGLVIDKKDVTSGGQPVTFTIQIDRAGDDRDVE
jgi:uncharacterized protein YjcR